MNLNTTLFDFLNKVWTLRLTDPLLFYGSTVLLIIFIVLAVKKRKSKLKAIRKAKEQRLIKKEKTKIEAADKKKDGDASVLEKEVLPDDQKLEKDQVEHLEPEKKGLNISEFLNDIENNKDEEDIKSKENDSSLKRQTTTPYVDTDETEVKIIDSLPESNGSKPKRIGYLPNDNFKQLGNYKYAVVKMPGANSLIKFPRKGRSDKKGHKEDEFFNYLNHYFRNDIHVFNDRHIPPKSGRPYEPDFVLSKEKDNKNIFINIEIDEPYDGWLGSPTHCIGDNDLRDDFFTKRGWIVIRFAEIQVHLEPIECCALIAKLIHSVDNTFTSDLLNVSNPKEVEQWSTLQAKKWSSQRYREEYLGIDSFGKRPKVLTEFNIIDSETDIAIEKEIPKPKYKKEVDSGGLIQENANNRDERISFDADAHRYFIDDNPDTISVTQLIDKFFPEFDSPYWSKRKAVERLIAEGISQTEENILSMQKDILNEWEDKRIDSASKGTALHESIENYYNGKPYVSNSQEFQQFLSFKDRYQGMIPYRSEWRIFDEDLLVAGTVDMVYKKEDGSLYMFDWKRSKNVINQDGSIKNDMFNSAYGDLAHLGDNSFNKYCLQQNIYKAILEKRYHKKISSMNLLVMHENYDRYHHIRIPNMETEVNHIFTFAYSAR